MKYTSKVGKITSTVNLLRHIARFFANVRYPFSKNSRDIFKEHFLKDFCGNYIYKRISKEVHEADFDQNKVPFFIISFNNLTYLKNTIKNLEKYNITNIHIIDNNSDYSPLIDYLKGLPYQVRFLDKNWGHRVLWDSHIFDDIIYNQIYVVTDPDLEFNSNLPPNFLYHMYKLLVQFPNITKVGFALKIDDLPKSDMNNKVLSWKNSFGKMFRRTIIMNFTEQILTQPLLYTDQVKSEDIIFIQHLELQEISVQNIYPGMVIVMRVIITEKQLQQVLLHGH